ncbi:MAG: DUF4416 family protein [Clostridia bacterium]|nr:DUF4416 family protein [Clostridia bacterium]
MGMTEAFEGEKLIMGFIYPSDEIYRKALGIMTERFGPIDFELEEFSFSKEYSSYYDSELGGEGLRRIVSFEKLVDPSLQADIKIYTNSVELDFSDEAGRKVNIDPGFMSHGRLLLATTKKTGFRIPLKDGIYSELTLFYARGDWRKLPWTYRDYQSEKVQKFLTKVRKKYLAQRAELGII